MVMTAFGGPEVFQAQDLPVPEPGLGQLRVRVYATAVNPLDYKIRAGKSRRRIAEPPAVIGYDAAGMVEALGPGARRFQPGDAVFYSPRLTGPGTCAEYHVVDEDVVAAKPHNLDFIQAAGLPLAGCTAWDAVTFFQLRPGHAALIHAGAGGVGSLAVQMARASGARVLATCRAANSDLVRDLGAEPIDYRAEDFAAAVLRLTDGRGVEAVYDTVGGDTLERSLACVRPYARLAGIVNVTGNLNPAYLKNATIYLGFMERAGHKIEALRVLAEGGWIHPVIDSVLPLEQVAEAHRRLEAGGVRGKIVLKVGE
ncbi:MAG: NADPH:quinone oxidoreductase [Candidatus Zixiibacteriota bacterium]|nr:MAG: NADPH:quinone oxidoreductase [candidate division Zixibacteria bacterium]